jgi:hypothetical protein
MRYYIHPQNLYGSVDEYFHFMYGYLFPFIQNTIPSYTDIYFLIECDAFNRFYKELKLYKINTIPKGKNLSYNIDMFKSFIGFDSIRCDYVSFNPVLVKDKIYKNFDRLNLTDNGHILLIDRLPPDTSNPNSKKHFSGTNRRSIPNIEDIKNLLYRKNIPFHFCHTENMSLRQQIELFACHKTIIAQHGAALSNMIFCDKDSHVIEIRPLEKNDEPWYENLSKIIGNRFTTIAQDHSHSPVNIELLEKHL